MVIDGSSRSLYKLATPKDCTEENRFRTLQRCVCWDRSDPTVTLREVS